jgi:hypothetical protein
MRLGLKLDCANRASNPKSGIITHLLHITLVMNNPLMKDSQNATNHSKNLLKMQTGIRV